MLKPENNLPIGVVELQQKSIETNIIKIVMFCIFHVVNFTIGFELNLVSLEIYCE